MHKKTLKLLSFESCFDKILFVCGLDNSQEIAGLLLLYGSHFLVLCGYSRLYFIKL